MITPRFLDPLIVQEVDDHLWQLVEELRYDSALLGARLIAPRGFLTDFSSVPRVPFAWWLAGDTGRKAGVIHDLLYRHRLPGDRALADRVFHEACRAEGLPRWRAELMYAGVRAAGARYW